MATRKRILSLFTAITMLTPLFGAMPVTANAAKGADIKLGDYVQMGTYDTDGDGTAEPILWRCVAFEKATRQADGSVMIDSTATNTEYQAVGDGEGDTGYLPLMLADDIICEKEFDAAGEDKTGSHGRGDEKQRKNGSNYWGDSNLRDWLNSSEEAGNVVWSCGNAPTYANEAGFLTNFTAAEKAAIQTAVQKTTLTAADIELEDKTGEELYEPEQIIADVVKNYSDAYSQWFTDTMFLMDTHQLYNVYVNDESLGSNSYYYIDGDSGYLLRTPFYYTGAPASYAYQNIIVIAYIDIEDGAPILYVTMPFNDGRGVRPAFFLNAELEFLSGNGEKGTPYSIPAAPSHNHKLCNDENCAEHEDVAWTAWTNDSSMPATAGSYYLTADVTIDSEWRVPEGTTNLCLNGYTLTNTDASRDGKVINICSNAELNLCDCSSDKTGKITGSTPDGVAFSRLAGGETSAPVFNMYGGIISGINHTNSENPVGAAVNITADNAEFHMYGGTIKNNEAVGVNALAGKFFVSGTVDISKNGSSYAQMMSAMSEQLANMGINLGNIGTNIDIAVKKGNAVQLETPITMANKSSIFMPSEDMTFCGTFTQGWNEKMSGKNPADYFTSASDVFEVKLDDSGEVELAKKHMHTLVHHEPKKATCTEAGTGEYWKCEGKGGCNRLFSDADGTTEITEIPVGESAKGHTLVPHAAVDATCSAIGNREYWQCSTCGNVFEDKEATRELDGIPSIDIDPTAHDYGAWTIITEPTIEATGTAERVCTKNNTHKDNVTLPVLTDTTVWTAGSKIEPTETTDGSQEYTSEYGAVTVIIPATGVTRTEYSEVIIKDGAPNVKVEGLDELAAETDPTAQSVIIKMIIERKAEDSADAEQNAIKSVSASGMIDYFNLSLIKIVDAVESSISETVKTLKIVIPFDMTGKKNIKVYRYHGGSAAALSENAADGEYYTVDDSVITVYANKFSTYAIGYDTETTEPTPSTKPHRGGSGSSSSYKVIFNAGENGKITKGNNSISVSRNSKIKEASIPTVTANEGYTFIGWSIDGKTAVDPTAAAITKTTTFTALYEAVTTPPTTGPTQEPAITPEVKQHKAYIVGYESVFVPDGNITRAETAAILARLTDGFDESVSYTAVFPDVAENAWYKNYIGFEENRNIIVGYEDGTFKPEENITRAEFANMIMRFAKLSQKPDDTPFTDISGHWAEAQITACCGAGYIKGYEDNTFLPDNYITRAEAVAIINRVLDRSDIKVFENPFIDVKPTHWAYRDIMEASVTHNTENN